MAIFTLHQPLSVFETYDAAELLRHDSSMMIFALDDHAQLRVNGTFNFSSTNVGTVSSFTLFQYGRELIHVSGLSVGVWPFVNAFDRSVAIDSTWPLITVLGNGNDIWNGSAGNDILEGYLGNDVLRGNDGNDTLDGHEGADQMVGGRGNDIYYFDNAGDRVVELAGQGNDTVIAYVDHALSANVENLELIGSAIRGTGNTLNNRIEGNDLNNVLDGRGGRDTLAGGAGNDLYIAGATTNVVEAAGGGIDTVRSDTSRWLEVNVENLHLVGTANNWGAGNSANNDLVGNAGANILDGFSGNDVLRGGAGNDTLRGGSGNDTLVGGAGADRFVFNGGRDIISDFELGADAVMLGSAALGFESRAEVMDAIRVWGNGLMIDGPGANDLIIWGVAPEDFRNAFVLM